MGVLLDEIFFRKITEVFIQQDVDFLHSRVGITLAPSNG